MIARPRQDDPDEVERRRLALQHVLSKADLSPAEAARLADMPTPNALYNFFSKRTKSLSLETYQRLAKVIPGATVSSLQGEAQKPLSLHKIIQMRAEARAGLLRDGFDLPAEQQCQLPFPVSPASDNADAFGVIVRRPGAEQLYPDGTFLVVIPIAGRISPLSAGRKVVLKRMKGARVEITVREIELRQGKAWLWPRSTEPAHVAPAEMPWPFSAEFAWRHGDSRYALAGVVIGAYLPNG